MIPAIILLPMFVTAASQEGRSLHKELWADFDLIQYSAMTTDSVFGIDVTCIVPTDGSCFIFGGYDYHLMDGLTQKTNVCLGMIPDWDIPSDTAADNGSGSDVARNSVWQFGAEYHADKPGICDISETDRLGGMALLSGMFRNAWTADNSAHQEPPAYDPKFLYSQMSSLIGIDLYTPGYGQPAFIDLHTGFTLAQTHMNPGETFACLFCLVTTNEGEADFLDQIVAAEAWVNAHIPRRIVCLATPTATFRSTSGMPFTLSITFSKAARLRCPTKSAVAILTAIACATSATRFISSTITSRAVIRHRLAMRGRNKHV